MQWGAYSSPVLGTIKRSARAATIAVRTSLNVWSDKSLPPWVTDVVDRLSSVVNLEHHWDGVNGVPVAQDALKSALEVLADTMSPDSVAPNVVPTPDGGLQLEWHCAGVDLEVYIESDGRVSAWCREGSREWEEDFYSRARISKELSLLTTAFCR